MATSRDRNTDAFEAVAEAAGQSDVVLMFLGEESILSGEAHCRADINLPGAQAELVRKLKAAGKPIIAVILAGRPLTLTNVIDEIDALLFAGIRVRWGVKQFLTCCSVISRHQGNCRSAFRATSDRCPFTTITRIPASPFG